VLIRLIYLSSALDQVINNTQRWDRLLVSFAQPVTNVQTLSKNSVVTGNAQHWDKRYVRLVALHLKARHRVRVRHPAIVAVTKTNSKIRALHAQLVHIVQRPLQFQ
jgi:hypothetical protein